MPKRPRLDCACTFYRGVHESTCGECAKYLRLLRIDRETSRLLLPILEAHARDLYTLVADISEWSPALRKRFFLPPRVRE